jgi:hypothetical protein
MTATAAGPRGTEVTDAAESRRPGPDRSVALEAFFVAVVALVGLAFGLRRIGDNSALLHIRTGIDMAHGSGIPRVDAYSFTAHGHAWVVQSWLAEWAYGWAVRLGGAHLLLLLQGALVAAVTLLMCLRARAGSSLRTLAAATIAFGVLVEGISPRPLLVGLLCLALTVTILERGWSPWWQVPVVWVWVNSHGSFPLGVAWLFLVAAGAALDRREVPRRELRNLGAFAVGLVVAAVNPLGPKLLAFPLAVRDKQVIFKTIVEWRSPNFQSASGIVTLAFLTLAVMVLIRARLGWADALPVAFFLAIGLFAVRNLAPAAVVLAPALGRALRPGRADASAAHATADGALPAEPTPPEATPAALTPADVRLRRRAGRRPVDRAFALVLAIVAVGLVAYSFSAPAYDLHNYPVALVTRAKAAGWLDAPHRMAEQDWVGDYVAARFGGRARVFIDDRYDMYPVDVSQGYEDLLHGSPASVAVLTRFDVDVVLWDDHQPLVPILQAAGWHQVDQAGHWVLLQRPGT